MGLLEDTGEYPTVGNRANPVPFLDPFKGFVLGERPDRRESVTASQQYGYAGVPFIGGPTAEQPAVLEVVRWRRPAVYLGGLLARIIDSRFLDRIERRIFK